MRRTLQRLLLACPLILTSPGLEDFVNRTPACSSRVDNCFGIVVHVPRDEHGNTVVTADWLAHRIEAMNVLYTDIDVNFQVIAAVDLDNEYAVVARNKRVAIARGRTNKGVIDLFLTGKLATRKSEIRGIKLSSDPMGSWIILSGISNLLVLAHEIGHYFGLGHSEYKISIMNKNQSMYGRPRKGLRSFHEKEYRRMKWWARSAKKNGWLYMCTPAKGRPQINIGGMEVEPGHGPLTHTSTKR